MTVSGISVVRSNNNTNCTCIQFSEFRSVFACSQLTKKKSYEGLETDRSCTGRPGAGRPCIGLHCTVPGPVVEYTRTTLLIQ